MKTFKVGHLRLISSLHEGFKARLYKSCYSTTENHLFAKEVCLCLLFKRCLYHSSPCSSYGFCISQSFIPACSSGILINGHKGWNTLSFLVHPSYQMSWSLWSYHKNVHIPWRNYLLEVYVKTVGKGKTF